MLRLFPTLFIRLYSPSPSPPMIPRLLRLYSKFTSTAAAIKPHRRNDVFSFFQGGICEFPGGCTSFRHHFFIGKTFNHFCIVGKAFKAFNMPPFLIGKASTIKVDIIIQKIQNPQVSKNGG